ncbi:hypothetical protein M404DRAFT_27633 [Pisolithus tinctorius Marx 270]|uniref:Uncharacterized protein n=1 Tax=Pisolithus tinctorius Marx 270 TaxID=870435 RepID=A0A0C3P5D6_PISTI|nr:hypothetical protein M404DRAFT_27633 [Pisolithus tinctorius Marx 270]
MSESRLTTMIDNNNKGQVVINWTQVSDDAIRYETDDEEEMMRAKAKERKRVAREQAEAKRIAWEAEEERACEEEERCKAEEEREAEQRHKAKEGDEARASSSEAAGVKKVVMDPSCTCCAWAKTICEFAVDGNKKCIACVHCNLSKGKCCWPRDGKDNEASPKVKANKGKKRKPDDEMPEPRPSQKKRAKSKAVEVLEIDEHKTGRSGAGKAGAAMSSGLEEKLERLIDTAGMIANNLAGLFELQEATVENSGHIADALKLLLNESYGYGMAVSPSDSGSSELNSDEMCEEAKWLKTHSKDKEEETKGEDEAMAEAE